MEFHKILNINETSDITDITSDITEITDMFRIKIAPMDITFSGQLLRTTGKSGKSSISTTVKRFQARLFNMIFIRHGAAAFGAKLCIFTKL